MHPEGNNIDVAHLWENEIHSFDQKEGRLKYYEELYEYLKVFYLLKRHKPFISKEEGIDNPEKQHYYDNYIFRLANATGPVDFFKYGDAFFDMAENCIISPSDVSLRDFRKLFALSITRLPIESTEQTIDFLNHHLEKSFSGNKDAFKVFLNNILNVESVILNPTTVDRVKTWMAIYSSTDISINEDNLLLEAVNRSKELVDFSEKKKPDVEQTLKVDAADFFLLPEAAEILSENPILQSTEPIKIKGELTDDQVRHYFSFLYFTDNQIDKSFLTKDEVEEIFKNGIEIPATPRSEKFELNVTPRFPKKIVDYFIYTFYVRYNPKAKVPILKFFGSYIKNYEKALDPLKITSVKSNLTGEKPSSTKFNPADYLPKTSR